MTRKSILLFAMVAALSSLATGCADLTPEQRRQAYENHLARQQRASMSRWELNRSGTCERLPNDYWRCDAGTP